MPQTPSVIPNLPIKSAGLVDSKALSRPSKGQESTFANLLGIENLANAGPVLKGRAASLAEAQDDAAGSSRTTPENSTNGAEQSPTLNTVVADPNQGQAFPISVQAVFQAAYIPTYGAEMDVSATSASATGRVPNSQLDATAAGDTALGKSIVQSFKSFVEQQASQALRPAKDGSITPPAMSPSPVDTTETTFAPDPSLASSAVAKSTESSAHSISDAEYGINAGLAMPGQLTGPVKAPSPAVLVRSETHFVPEATTPVSLPGNSTPYQPTAPSPVQNPVETPVQTGTPSQQQFAIASPPSQPELLQSIDFKRSRTQAASQTVGSPDSFPSAGASAERPASTDPKMGPSVTPSVGRQSASDGSTKDAVLYRYQSPDTASTGASHLPEADDGRPVASVEASQPSEGGTLIVPGAVSPLSGSPGQQIFSEIQRAVSPPTGGQPTSDTLQSSQNAQQPLKTITIALSPPNLGNVAVELSFKSGKLGVNLHVQEAGTVKLLRQDGSLEKLLESAGYAVQSLSVNLAQPSQPAATAQAAPNAQTFSGQFNSSGGSQQQGNPKGYNGQSADRHQDQRPGYGRAEDISGGSSLYV